MTREVFEKKITEHGFRKIFESSYETAWKSGKNQIELISEGNKILLARSDCMVLEFTPEAVEDIFVRENTYPEELIIALAYGISARVEYKR